MTSIDYDSAKTIAAQRWFTASELDFLLQNFQSIGFSITHDRGTALPPSGQFYFFPRRNYKTDGYVWVRKKGRDTIREDMVKISVDGSHVVTGRYTYSLETPGLCRRTYEHVSSGGTICMVHYRLCPLEEMPKRAAISSAARVREEAQGAAGLSDNALDERLVEELLVCAESMGLTFPDEQGPALTADGANYARSGGRAALVGAGEASCWQSGRNRIVDLEPRRHWPGDGDSPGTAVIVCLEQPVSFMDSFSVVFGDNDAVVPAVYVTPHCLKCIAPRLQSTAGSAVPLHVVSSNGGSVTPPSDIFFSFGVSIVAPAALSVPSPASTASRSGAMEVDAPVHQADNCAQGIPAPPLMFPSFHGMFASRGTSEHAPDLGMRFAEKLGSVAAVLGGNSSSKRGRESRMGAEKSLAEARIDDTDGTALAEPTHPPLWSDGWLDDKALNQLSNGELQELIDSFIGTYMGQLVQLASVDAELKQELNVLDRSGFALLHYCSMYDLPDLVETLLLKSATDINICTADGLTSLHLAAGSGHSNVVRILTAHGADGTIIDGEGYVAAQRAFQGGFDDLGKLLSEHVGPSGDEQQFWSSPLLAPNVESLPPAGSPLAVPKRESSTPTVRRCSGSQFFNQSPKTTTSKQFFPSPDHADSAQGDSACGGSSPKMYTSPEHAPSVAAAGNLNLLQTALSSLSLTDKCALSLSLGPLPSGGNLRLNDSKDFELPTAFGSFSPTTESGSKLFEDIDSVFDSQSVLSESDMESLDVAMSMMGPQELEKVESEVKLIQSNVRTWILRKNYTNLRDAARVLQTAWRVKKKDGPQDCSTSTPRGVCSPLNRKKRRTSDDSILGEVPLDDCAANNNYNSSVSIGIAESFYRPCGPDRSDKLSSAAATLQAVTRGMLARKTFETAKRQGMASLVIQKSLVSWWTHNKDPTVAKHVVRHEPDVRLS